jgi:hypothetical protein
MQHHSAGSAVRGSTPLNLLERWSFWVLRNQQNA